MVNPETVGYGPDHILLTQKSKKLKIGEGVYSECGDRYFHLDSIGR